jgi:hypothetical protein
MLQGKFSYTRIFARPDSTELPKVCMHSVRISGTESKVKHQFKLHLPIALTFYAFSIVYVWVPQKANCVECLILFSRIYGERLRPDKDTNWNSIYYSQLRLGSWICPECNWAVVQSLMNAEGESEKRKRCPCKGC